MSMFMNAFLYIFYKYTSTYISCIHTCTSRGMYQFICVGPKSPPPTKKFEVAAIAGADHRAYDCIRGCHCTSGFFHQQKPGRGVPCDGSEMYRLRRELRKKDRRNMDELMNSTFRFQFSIHPFLGCKMLKHGCVVASTSHGFLPRFGLKHIFPPLTLVVTAVMSSLELADMEELLPNDRVPEKTQRNHTTLLVRMALAVAGVLGVCFVGMLTRASMLTADTTKVLAAYATGDININPNIHSSTMRLGETFMGNPGSVLSPSGWVTEAKSVEIENHPKPQAASIGEMLCSGCHFAEGYDCLSDTDWLPGNCNYLGVVSFSGSCQAHSVSKGMDMAKPPMGGVNFRGCPENVMAGDERWEDMASQEPRFTLVGGWKRFRSMG